MYRDEVLHFLENSLLARYTFYFISRLYVIDISFRIKSRDKYIRRGSKIHDGSGIRFSRIVPLFAKEGEGERSCVSHPVRHLMKNRGRDLGGGWKKEYRWKYQNRYLTPDGGWGEEGKTGNGRKLNWTGLWGTLATNVAAIFPIFDGSRERKEGGFFHLSRDIEDRNGRGGHRRKEERGSRRIFLRLFAKLKYSSKCTNICIYMYVFLKSFRGENRRMLRIIC